MQKTEMEKDKVGGTKMKCHNIFESLKVERGILMLKRVSG